MMRSAWLSAAALLALASPCAAQPVGDDDKLPTIQAHIYETTPLKPPPGFAARLKVPAGYRVNVFAQGLKNSRFISVAVNGDLYVNRNSQADVIRLRDRNGDGVADGPPEVVARRAGLLGALVHDDKLYLATASELWVADIAADGAVGEPRRLIKDLPGAGQHYTRHMEWGPDGWIYMGVGSTCNTCTESSPENATILRIRPDGKSRAVFASGLRHTIGFDWHPKTGEIWGWDQGIDWLGDDLQREEVNHIEWGKRYGWPYVMEDGKAYPQLEPDGGLSNADWAKSSTPPVLMHVAHSAGMQWAFHPGGGAMGGEVAGDAFVSLRGSWNRRPASGYEVARIRFSPDGTAQRVEPFVSGFLSADGTSNYGRLCGMAVAADGALLFTDDTNGVIYRVTRTGASGPFTRAQPPADAMKRQTTRGDNVPLALARDETRAAGRLAVGSPAFTDGAPLPDANSDYGGRASPPLRWSAAPGARSYVLLVEDPDGGRHPVIHWTAWNIPAPALPEALPTRDRLDAPGVEGLMQGVSSRGTTGWYGPRPPVGDPPHHYHFQVLALDRMLDLPLGATRDDILRAAAGHVLAKGETVATFQRTTPPES